MNDNTEKKIYELILELRSKIKNSFAKNKCKKMLLYNGGEEEIAIVYNDNFDEYTFKVCEVKTNIINIGDFSYEIE